jgi:hypothetical protein
MQRSGPNVTRSLAAGSIARPAPRSTAQPPPPTSRPTPQFQQHHQVQPPRIDAGAFRPGWLVMARVDSLLERGLIDREAWDAAHEWRRWAETVHPSPTTRLETRVDISTVPRDAGMLHRLGVATRLRECAEAIGPLRTKILEALIVHDRSWSELARLLQVSDKTAMARAAEAVAALADWRAGRSVASPPAIKFRNQPGRL